ncbi:MAG TPA: amidohydrolase family protein, partial [Jatrophihabitans sp.]
MGRLLITGGSVFTGLGDAPVPGAVLIRDGVIAAVGPDDEVARLAGSDDEVVQATGGLISAGFQDAHCHPVLAGLQRLSCDLSGAEDVEGYLEVVRRYRDAHPESGWISGGGWAMPHFPGGTPTRRLLDTVAADRPVYLINRDAHGAWVNTAALQAAGIDESTPDPSDGRIEREPDGYPSGTLHEGATALITRHLPEPTAETIYSALLEAQNHLLSLGITAWQDAIIGSYLGQPDPADAYRRAVAEDTLRARVVGALWWERSRGLDQLPELLAQRAELTGGRFRATSVKMMLDGVAENYTASMVEPYLDRCGHATANRGVDFLDPDRLGDYVTALDDAGFQVHFH